MACLAPIDFYVKFVIIVLIPPALLLLMLLFFYLPLCILDR